MCSHVCLAPVQNLLQLCFCSRSNTRYEIKHLKSKLLERKYEEKVVEAGSISNLDQRAKVFHLKQNFYPGNLENHLGKPGKPSWETWKTWPRPKMKKHHLSGWRLDSFHLTSFTFWIFVLVDWLAISGPILGIITFLDAIASPSTYPCQSVSEWFIVSDLEIAIAYPSFASLFLSIS